MTKGCKAAREAKKGAARAAKGYKAARSRGVCTRVKEWCIRSEQLTFLAVVLVWRGLGGMPNGGTTATACCTGGCTGTCAGVPPDAIASNLMHVKELLRTCVLAVGREKLVSKWL